MTLQNGSRRAGDAAGTSMSFSNAAELSHQLITAQGAARTRTELSAVWPPNADVAREAGHERQSPLRAIRAKCLDCSGGNTAEVCRCEAVKCPLWPFHGHKSRNRAERTRFGKFYNCRKPRNHTDR
jgi:hypothetical protein